MEICFNGGFIVSQTLASMPIPQVILIVIVICIGAGIVVRMIIKKRSDPDAPPMSSLDYLALIFDSVKSIMEDCLKICTIKPENFETSEEYMRALIEFGIAYLKQNANNLGIKTEYFYIIDQDVLEDFMYDVISQLFVKIEPIRLKA